MRATKNETKHQNLVTLPSSIPLLSKCILKHINTDITETSHEREDKADRSLTQHGSQNPVKTLRKGLGGKNRHRWPVEQQGNVPVGLCSRKENRALRALGIWAVPHLICLLLTAAIVSHSRFILGKLFRNTCRRQFVTGVGML